MCLNEFNDTVVTRIHLDGMNSIKQPIYLPNLFLYIL